LATKVSFDASAIVPLFIGDFFTSRIGAYPVANAPDPIASDFAAAEFASVIARRARMGQLTR
jgi:predicted nucleic acid-binding protein